jgi:hypothetical protein
VAGSHLAPLAPSEDQPEGWVRRGSYRAGVEIDFSDPAFLRDPYPELGLLRERAPVSWHAPTGSR